MNEETKIICEQILPALGRVEGKLDSVVDRTERVETKVDLVTTQMSEHLGYHDGLLTSHTELVKKVSVLESVNYKVCLKWGIILGGALVGILAHFRLGLFTFLDGI